MVCRYGHETEQFAHRPEQLRPCEACGSTAQRVLRAKAALVIGDDIPGGQWFENGFSTPRKFYSHSAHVKALDAQGLQIAPRYVEGSKHLTKWSSVDLNAATALVSRGSVARHREDVGPGGLALLPTEPLQPIAVTDAGWSITVKE